MTISAILASLVSLLTFTLIPSTVEAATTVCGLSHDGHRVFRWDNCSGGGWKQIGDTASAIYGGKQGLVATSKNNDELWAYIPESNSWTKLGGGGTKFVQTARSIYGLTPNKDAVYRWDRGTQWTKIGGTASNIYAGGDDSVFAVSEHNTEIWHWIGGDRWEKVGSGGADFAVNGQGELFGLSSGKEAVHVWTGIGQDWRKIGDKASKLVAGGFGFFAVSEHNTEIWRRPGGSQGGWEKVGQGGTDFAVSDEGLYGLDGPATKVYRWNHGESWSELPGAGHMKQIVPC